MGNLQQNIQDLFNIIVGERDNMKMDKVAGSGNDEFYTPKYAILPLIKYLKRKGFKKIWCPFDTKQSNFVILLKSVGFDVTYSHIENGEDFFDVEHDCDVIVSNPPYSIKTEVFERLFELDKPFAMLVGIVGLYESEKRFNLFRNNEIEELKFNRRIKYFQDYNEVKPSKNPPFSSWFICRGVLGKPRAYESISECPLYKENK